MWITLTEAGFAQSWPLFAAALLTYVLLVRLCRYDRARNLEKIFAPQGRASYSSLTTNQSQTILKDLTELEFPKLFGFSIIFALFKTYGIPSVSSLLVSTGELNNTKTASKRVADTGVILLDFALNDPTSERTLRAIARMNYLHAPYIQSGKITNDDLLYTLSLFALEPARWVDKYEWRSLTELELAACGTFWKSLGDAMDISFSTLPSHKEGWKDGLHWLAEVRSWSLQYEEKYMLPAHTNKRLADSHFEILCLNVPIALRPMCKKLMSVLLGARLQRAMMYPDPGRMLSGIVKWGFLVRRLLIRHLFLPRPGFMRKNYIPTSPNPETGRYNALEYLSFPWYVKPTFARRWGPRSCLTRLIGRKLPGDDGNCYAPDGWTHIDLGPYRMKGKGSQYMAQEEKRLAALDRGSCPFRPSRSAKN